MAKKSITDVVAIIVSELSPFTSEDRQRAVQASLTLLGETRTSGVQRAVADSEDVEADGAPIPTRAKTWIKQNGLSNDQLQQVFHFEGDKVEVITASIPGKNNREKVRNAYVLLGVSRLLSGGEPKFDDKSARALCEQQGFYDHTNHMKHMKGGNEFTGSKDKGWVLTAPGLKHGAKLVSDLGGQP
ncbi:MAG: hypothetical protein WDO17_17305 [Alphaproteobacteria bacterium]